MTKAWIKIASAISLLSVAFGGVFAKEVIVEKIKNHNVGVINSSDEYHKNFSYFVVTSGSPQDMKDYYCQIGENHNSQLTFDCEILKINSSYKLFGGQKNGSYIIINQNFLNSPFSEVKLNEKLKENEHYILRAPANIEYRLKTKNTKINVNDKEENNTIVELSVVASNFGPINNIEIHGAITKKIGEDSACQDCYSTNDIWQFKYDSNYEECELFTQKTQQTDEYIFSKDNFTKAALLDTRGHKYKAIKFQKPKNIRDLKNKKIDIFVKKNSSNSYSEKPLSTTIFHHGIIGDFGENIFPKILVE